MGFRDLKNAFKHRTNQNEVDQNKPPPPPPRNYKRNIVNKDSNNNSQIHNQTPMGNFQDILNNPIAQGEPPHIFRKVKHAQLPIGCKFDNLDSPIQTNNFSNNLTLQDQTFPIWTLPYSFWLTKDPNQDYGFAFNHTEASQRVFGPDPNSSIAQYYFNPPKIKSFIFTSYNFDANLKLTLENHKKLSITAKLINNHGSIKIPLVYGMGYITAIYENIPPIIASQVGIQEFNSSGRGNMFKYRVKLFNQVEWTIYSQSFLKLSDPNHIIGDQPGLIQIVRGTSNVYDSYCGSFIESADLSAFVNGDVGHYEIKYNIINGNDTVIWALPHHQESIINCKPTDLTLDSPTKGIMKAYCTNKLIMEEKLPIDIMWDPWASFKPNASFSFSELEIIKQAAIEDVKQDVVSMANLDSMYFSGKIVDKFAYIAYVCKFILKDEQLTNTILPKVKQAIEIFASNNQKNPLVYDTVWKGLISSSEPNGDFGNSNYNDHHFHYGYHIHAIALIAKIDPQWLYSNNNLIFNFANTMLRDVANPFCDEFFPQFRCFDWFHGHSFAHGIFASGDGKDEESSSEDYHFAYGMKLYGNIIGDFQMENRGNLMLAIMKRSMNLYMLFSNDNQIQPKQIIPNKVAGITFENKLDFATYFGRGEIEDEYINGIHQIPITPVSSFIRSSKFVKEEWDIKIAHIIDRIPNGWKGILMLNLALYDPKAAWNWFARKDWDQNLIDPGMSRTWSLAFIAGIL